MNCRLRPDARAAVLWLAAAVALLSLPAPAVAVDAPQWIAALWLPAKEAVGMRWHPVPGATGYRVLRNEAPGGANSEVARTTEPQYFDAEVSGGKSFSYVLQALVGDEASPDSLPRTVQVPHLPPAPEPPIWRDKGIESVTRQGETRQSVRLGWTKRTDLPVTNIYRSEVAGGPYKLVGSVMEDTFTDWSVEEGKAYFYVLTTDSLRAVESVHSPEKTVFTAGPRRPPPPAALLYVLHGDPAAIAAFRYNSNRDRKRYEPWKQSELLGRGPGRLTGCGPNLCAAVGTEIVVLDRDLAVVGRRAFRSLGALAAEGGLLYAGAEHSLVILDGSLQELGRVPFGEKDAHDILVREGTAYVLDNIAQPIYLFRVDVRDPRAPRIVWSVREHQVAHVPRQWLQPDLGLWVVQHDQWGQGVGSTNELLLLPMSLPAATDEPVRPPTLKQQAILTQTIYARTSEQDRKSVPIPPEHYLLFAVTPDPPHLAIIRTLALQGTLVRKSVFG